MVSKMVVISAGVLLTVVATATVTIGSAPKSAKL
jgi:hypothetical protein